MADHQRRKKVTLVWNGEDIARVFGSLFQAGDIAKYIDLPLANYATLPFDKVLKDGKIIGLSTYTGYTYNERAMISLGVVDVAQSEPGTLVTVVWGEEARGSTKPTVERHKQARDTRHGGRCALRRSGARGIPAALDGIIREHNMAYIFHEDDLPKMVAVVSGGRERTFFVNKELTNIDDMLAGVMVYKAHGSSPYHYHEICEHFYFIMEGKGSVESEEGVRAGGSGRSGLYSRGRQAPAARQ